VNSTVFDLLKFFQTKLILVQLLIFQIKYVFEGNQIRKTFLYRNFSTFGVEFKLKFKEALGLEIHRNLIGILMNLKKFDLETPNCTCRIDKLMEW
jgi:hypothetical protein